MTTELEWGTGMLTSRCMKRVQLQIQGKSLPEVTSAMFRGSIFHKLAECWHTGQTFDLREMHASVNKEGRRMTLTCARDSEETAAEMRGLLDGYTTRYGQYFRASKLLGCEVPIRWTVDVDGKPAVFRSYLDLIFRDPHGLLNVWDWKTGDTDWDGDYAARSLQVGMYFMATQYGHVKLGDEWIALEEAPSVSIISVENLKPYMRKTTARGDDGMEREFVKGDARPETSVRREVMCNNEAGILEQFKTRVRMARLNLWPTNPTDTGCRACSCREACPTWSTTEESDATV